MPHIDTLATARRLEQAGLPTEHARAVSEAIADAVRDSQPDLSHLATKTDLKDLELRIAERLRSQMVWFFTVLAALLGIAVAIIKFTP